MSYTVAVRALCEFTAKAGDLDLRFTPSPTAQEGIAGHSVVAARRGAGYESEIALQGSYRELTVRGRADGYDPARNQLEETKTHRGDLSRQPANHRHLHWAQLKVYGWLLCEARGLPALTLALVYFDIGSQRETVVTQTAQAADLHEFFDTLCDRFLHWAKQEMAHRAARDAALAALAFPHDSFRTGQRELAESVYKAAAQGKTLLAQAPTGIGKTVGTLFPLLKAMPGQKIDKLFYLAAKTPGRQLALDALARLQIDALARLQVDALTRLQGDALARPGNDTPSAAAAPALRVLELVARDKACEHPDKACHGQSCPLAQGFYDRLPAARSAAVQAGPLHRAALREVALAHRVCPYYLSQELARWADVVVGDYNYFFDASALLHALATEREWRVAALVDEAHNLLERGRGMYSGQLHPAAFRAARQGAPAALKKPLDKVLRAWNELARGQTAPYETHADIPARFALALREAAAAIGDHLAEVPEQPASGLQQFYFDALQFVRLADSFGAHSLFDVTLLPASAATGGKSAALLCIRNLIPAPFLAPRFATAHSTTLFSATLSPRGFYQDTLGLPERTAWLDVESPFTPEQLRVRLVPQISTRFADRARSAAPIARLIAQQFAAQPGNYLAFFSSYDYLQMVLPQLRALAPGVPVWEQSRRMDEAERQQFLARFAPGGQGVGFAVLGGSFAEGIDLPGDRLVGAFIATLGLPQINPVNEQMKARMAQTFGAGEPDAGYHYTYLFPGIQKVVQAAGRVIRTQHDRGVIYLIDDRFARPDVRALLPPWWDVQLHFLPK